MAGATNAHERQVAMADLLLGAIPVRTQSVLDDVAGEIARLQCLSSVFGEWRDNVLDDFVNIRFGIGLGYTTALMIGQALYHWLGLTAGLGLSLYNLVLYASCAS